MLQMYKKKGKIMLSQPSAMFYLISGLFILALISSPDTSRQDYFGIAGMIIAIVVTFCL